MGRIIRRRKVYLENTWTCSSCQATNKGRDMSCTGCGNKKEPDEAYVPPPDLQTAPEVTDPERKREAEAGPNWTCDFCGGHVRNQGGQCRECAAPKPEPRPVPTPDAWLGRRPSLPDGPGRRTWLIVAGSVLLVLLVIGFFIARARPDKRTATVESMTWSRDVELERRVVHDGTGWRSDAPGGAYAFACAPKKKGTEKCDPYDCNPHKVSYRCEPHDCNPHREEYDCDPYDCNCRTHRENCEDEGNGYTSCDEVESCDTCYKTCTRTEYDTCYNTCWKTEYDTCWKECDVIRDWCTYKHDTWPVVDRGHDAGVGPGPRWPERPVAKGADERLDRSETFGVTFAAGEKRWTYVPKDETDYARFRPGETWKIKAYRNGKAAPQEAVRAELEPDR